MKPFPSPHQLDFDWRFDSGTSQNVAKLVRGANKVLALGVPTVARLIEAEGVDVTLVDRQPNQGVRNHLVLTVEDFVCEPVFDAAIIDPPWYPQQLKTWARIAGRAVISGGSILLSVWPRHTRPTAETELEVIFGSFAKWSKVERNVCQLNYLEPGFETIARDLGDNNLLSRSPLRGELVRLRVESQPNNLPIQHSGAVWHRFVINDYQLAVRLGKQTSHSGVYPLPMAVGWLWPYVSARASGIESISIWSSEGEVGIVGDATTIVECIQKLPGCQDIASFERALADVPRLLEWRLPRPPFGRFIEWQHRQ